MEKGCNNCKYRHLPSGSKVCWDCSLYEPIFANWESDIGFPTFITSRGNCIKKVIFNDPATIVFWSDGTKTVVKCTDEAFDKEKGLAMAISKKFLGNNKSSYNNIFKKWCKEDEVDKEVMSTIIGVPEIPSFSRYKEILNDVWGNKHKGE